MLKWIMILGTCALCSCISPESPLHGEWQMINWNGEKPLLDIYYNFKNNGEYTDSRTGVHNGEEVAHEDKDCESEVFKFIR